MVVFSNDEGLGAHKAHPRRFRGSELVYPVLSRRSRGISVGVNLNLDQNCNFRCLYCQVDGSESRSDKLFSLDKLATELPETLGMIQSGEIYQYDPFMETPGDLRHLRDIAISGDGEPTASKHFGSACEVIVRIKDQMGLEDVKIVLITNASLLHKDSVRRTLAMLYDHKLEVWGKLDAGTEGYYHLVNGSSIPFDRILENLLATARVRPIVIQSLFVRIDGEPVSRDEVAAYAERLAEIEARGGQIKAVQLYTIARPARDTRVTAMSPEDMESVASQVAEKVAAPLERY